VDPKLVALLALAVIGLFLALKLPVQFRSRGLETGLDEHLAIAFGCDECGLQRSVHIRIGGAPRDLERCYSIEWLSQCVPGVAFADSVSCSSLNSRGDEMNQASPCFFSRTATNVGIPEMFSSSPR
jgi:hypothetical protein